MINLPYVLTDIYGIWWIPFLVICCGALILGRFGLRRNPVVARRCLRAGSIALFCFIIGTLLAMSVINMLQWRSIWTIERPVKGVDWPYLAGIEDLPADARITVAVESGERLGVSSPTQKFYWNDFPLTVLSLPQVYDWVSIPAEYGRVLRNKRTFSWQGKPCLSDGDFYFERHAKGGIGIRPEDFELTHCRTESDQSIIRTPQGIIRLLDSPRPKSDDDVWQEQDSADSVNIYHYYDGSDSWSENVDGSPNGVALDLPVLPPSNGIDIRELRTDTENRLTAVVAEFNSLPDGRDSTGEGMIAIGKCRYHPGSVILTDFTETEARWHFEMYDNDEYRQPAECAEQILPYRLGRGRLRG